MTIDSFYTTIDKNYYYIGRISQVYRESSVAQIENLSLLSYRKFFNESIIPNSINYLVVIDSIQGIFLGKVFQNKFAFSEKVRDSVNIGKIESIFPEINIDIIGLMTYHDKKFKLPEFMTVGIYEKVYLANNIIIQKYLESIELTKTEEEKLTSFANFLDINQSEISLKPSTLFNHHLFIVGTTNSGKSSSALSILDKLIMDHKKILIIDPTGEYDESFNDDEIIKLNLGINTTISPGKISMQQWSILFEANSNSQSSVLAEAIRSLQYQYKNKNDCYLKKEREDVTKLLQKLSSINMEDSDFDISLLPKQIMAESVIEKNGKYAYDSFKANINNYLVQKVTYQLSNTTLVNFFNANSKMNDLLDEIKNFLNNNTSLYINTSMLGSSDGIGGMIIELLCNYILSQNNIVPFVFFIDEVHRYTKSQFSDEEFYNRLTLIAREGRKKGIFLFLSSQNPQDVSPKLLGQIGTMLIHRLSHNNEIVAIKNKLDDSSIHQIKKLNQGEAVLTSINLIQNIFLRITKCNRPQKNETPLL